MLLEIFKDTNWLFVIIWAVIFIATLIIELETFNVTTIWFCISALVSLILAAFNVLVVIQVIVFIILSIILLIITKPLVKKVMNNKITKTNSDRVIGMIGVVTKEISPDQYGEVNIQGSLWRAVNYNSLTFTEGEKVRIEEISGVKVIVSKVN